MSWPIVGIIGVVLLLFFSYNLFPTVPSKPIELSSFLDLNDTPNSYNGQAGKVPTVNGTENGLIFLDVNGGGGLGDTNQVKVSVTDTTPGYLSSKIQAGSNITLSVQNPGGNENILISSSGGGSVDGNGSILGTANQVNVTNGLSRLFDDANVVLSLPQNIDTSATPQFSGLTLSPCSTFQIDSSPQLRFKVDCAGPTVSSTTFIPVSAGTTDIGTASNRWDDFWITDVNATGTGDFKILKYDGNTVLTKQDADNYYIQTNPLLDQNINVKDLNINGGAINITPANNDTAILVKNQTGKTAFKVDANGNIRIDGNTTFIDVNSNFGNAGVPAGTIHANTFRGIQTSGGFNLVIGANTYAFAVFGTTGSGLYFNASAPRGFYFRINGDDRWGFGAGATGVDGVLYQYLRTTEPSGTQSPMNLTYYFDKGTIDYNNQPIIRRNNVYQHLMAQAFLGTPKDLIIDANWMGDIYASGDYRIDGNVVVDKNIYGQLVMPGNLTGVSCNTTCGAISYAGSWACVEADNVTGASSTCSDTSVAHNCLCRN